MPDIAFIGSAGVGKDSVFRALQEIDAALYVRRAYADFVRGFLEAQFPDEFPHGIDWDSAKKRERVRRLIQRTGMAGRSIDPNMWVRMLADAVDDIPLDKRVVVTDARMENEIVDLQGMNFFLVYLDRPLADSGASWRSHPSEHEWRRYIDVCSLQFTGTVWTPASAAASIHHFLNERGNSN